MIEKIFFSARKFAQDISEWDFSNIKHEDNTEHAFTAANAFLKKFNDGDVFPDGFKAWFNKNGEKMKEISYRDNLDIDTIKQKIEENKTMFEDFFKEHNIDPKSDIGLELTKEYDKTQNKLLDSLEDKTRDVVKEPDLPTMFENANGR